MVLELKVPDDPSLQGLRAVAPTLVTYALSYLYLGIYWNNHHHLIHAAEHINGAVLWANLFLLFWLSLIPFATHWMGHSSFAPGPTALYGVILLLAAGSFKLLVISLLRIRSNTRLAQALGTDRKGNVSVVVYVLAAVIARSHQTTALFLYAAVAAMWLVPDRRIERRAA